MVVASGLTGTSGEVTEGLHPGELCPRDSHLGGTQRCLQWDIPTEPRVIWGHQGSGTSCRRMQGGCSFRGAQRQARGSGHQGAGRRLPLSTRQHLCAGRAAEHWPRLPREAVGVSSWESGTRRLDGVLGVLLWVVLCGARSWT